MVKITLSQKLVRENYTKITIKLIGLSVEQRI